MFRKNKFMSNHVSCLVYKVVLVGDGEVGKTTFIKNLKKNAFGEKVIDNTYIPTMGTEVHPIVYQTNMGTITLKLWDTAEQEKFSGLRKGYYIQSDYVIIMYNLTNDLSKKVSSYIDTKSK